MTMVKERSKRGRSALKAAFRASIPVLFGYIPLGMAFGILFSTLGLPWYFASVSSLMIFAGAAQFLSVGMLAAKTGLPEIFTATLILNLRHVFYGFSLLKRYKKAPLKGYLIFGLTDETFSVLTSSPKKEDHDQAYCQWLTALNHSYWVLGSTVGAGLGALIRFDTRGFDFVLLALFLVLAIEQWFSLKKEFPFIVGGVISFLALFVFPRQFLFVSIGLTAAFFLIFAEVKSYED